MLGVKDRKNQNTQYISNNNTAKDKNSIGFLLSILLIIISNYLVFRASVWFKKVTFERINYINFS